MRGDARAGGPAAAASGEARGPSSGRRCGAYTAGSGSCSSRGLASARAAHLRDGTGREETRRDVEMFNK